MCSQIADPGLWSRYVAFMKAGLALIRQRCEREPVPTAFKATVRRQDRTTTSVEYEPQPDAFWLVVPLFDALQKLREFEELHRYIVSSRVAERVFVDAGNNPIRQPEAQSHWLMNFYMMPILTQYMGPELILDFHEGRAEAFCADLETSLECTEAVYSVLAPLQHFDGPDEEIRLNATTVLRRLAEDEIAYLCDLGRFGGMVERSQALSMGFCVATPLVTEKGAFTNFSQPRGHLGRVLSALRLLKFGQVGMPVVIGRLREPAFGLPGGTVGTSGPGPAAPGPTYTLLLEETEALIAMHETLAEVASAKELRVALRRFNYAYERTRPDDRLIDYWIALEALFLPGISDELSFRASLRIAYYVGTSPDEREEVYEKMRLSYKTRSDVVHGEQPKADVRGVASDTEEILRRALRAEVMSPGSLDVRRLDAAIARGQGAAQSGGTR